MSKKKVIVKDLNAIQNFGAMNILCSDKTGTLTCDQIVLEKYINADGSDDDQKRILRHAYFNSFFQTGLKNLMDKAILSHVKELDLESMKDNYHKVDEIPFDFTRRRMSVVIEDPSGKRQIVTKGAVEEMLEICSHTEVFGSVCPFTPELRKKAATICERMNHQGLRVLAVAHKNFLSKENNFSIEDESDMVLIGFLAFLDPPKPSAANAIEQLQNYGVSVKILSGDNEAVVRTIARQVGITGKALSGREMEALEGEALYRAVQKTSVSRKSHRCKRHKSSHCYKTGSIQSVFWGRNQRHRRTGDSPISHLGRLCRRYRQGECRHYFTGKDLMVLRDGVIEGRRTFGNIVKYIKMTASSNFVQYVQCNGCQRIPALPSDDADPPSGPKPALRYLPNNNSVRLYGCGVPAETAQMGCVGIESLS